MCYFVMELVPVTTWLFLCGTANDITPLVSVDSHPVGPGTPGPFTVQLRDALDARLYGRR